MQHCPGRSPGRYADPMRGAGSAPRPAVHQGLGGAGVAGAEGAVVSAGAGAAAWTAPELPVQPVSPSLKATTRSPPGPISRSQLEMSEGRMTVNFHLPGAIGMVGIWPVQPTQSAALVILMDPVTN